MILITRRIYALLAIGSFRLIFLTLENSQLCIDSTIAYLAEKFGGVTPGACADEGYTVFDHTETVSMGPLGDAEVKIYTKP